MPETANMEKVELTREQLEKFLERENEAEAAEGIVDDQHDADAGADDTGGERRARAEGGDDGEPQERQKPIAMSPMDEKRLKMADRFKRSNDERPFDGDFTREENLYGEVADENLADDLAGTDPAEPAAAAPAQDERIHTIKVRGKEVKLTTAELLERASKVEAADSYLQESRDLLEQAKQIRGPRAAPDAQHPEREDGTQDDRLDQDDRQPTRRPGPDLTAVVEKIQFGDPKEAAAELANVIRDEAGKIANEGHVARLVANDQARTKQALKAFREKYADLDKDEIAAGVIDRQVNAILFEEIKSLGVDEAQIPRDPRVLADWHRLYRVHGHELSKPDQVLEQAKSRFDKWRGVSSEPAPAPRTKEAPRVAVNVDRTQRRMAIPNQPSAAVTPRRPAAAPVTEQNSRKSAVQEMRRSRGQTVA